jgi:hypothetical protein
VHHTNALSPLEPAAAQAKVDQAPRRKEEEEDDHDIFSPRSSAKPKGSDTQAHSQAKGSDRTVGAAASKAKETGQTGARSAAFTFTPCVAATRSKEAPSHASPVLARSEMEGQVPFEDFLRDSSVPQAPASKRSREREKIDATTSTLQGLSRELQPPKGNAGDLVDLASVTASRSARSDGGIASGEATRRLRNGGTARSGAEDIRSHFARSGASLEASVDGEAPAEGQGHSILTLDIAAGYGAEVAKWHLSQPSFFSRQEYSEDVPVACLGGANARGGHGAHRDSIAELDWDKEKAFAIWQRRFQSYKDEFDQHRALWDQWVSCVPSDIVAEDGHNHARECAVAKRQDSSAHDTAFGANAQKSSLCCSLI